MLYALAHPVRTARWWRYRAHHVLEAHRAALVRRWADARGRRRAAAALLERTREAEAPAPERGEVIGRSLIVRGGEPIALEVPGAGDDRFAPHVPLIPLDAEGRRVW